MRKRDGKEEAVLEGAKDLCAEQKGVQSIIFRQADRAVWAVYFYLHIRAAWMRYGSPLLWGFEDSCHPRVTTS